MSLDSVSILTSDEYLNSWMKQLNALKQKEDLTQHTAQYTILYNRFNELLTERHCCPSISEFVKKGIIKIKCGNFKQAVSFYSKAILSLNRWYRYFQKSFVRHSENYISLVTILIKNKYCKLLLQRAHCLLADYKYNLCLADYRKIIELCKKSIDKKEDLINNYHVEMYDIVCETLWKRANLWLIIGNYGQCLFDLKNAVIESIEFGKKANEKLLYLTNRINDYDVNIKYYLKYNKSSKKLNKFSKKGWIQLKSAANNGFKLPEKYGHIMIEYNSTIYVLSGTSIHLGKKMFTTLTDNERNYDKSIFFFKININKKNNTYNAQKLLFPFDIIRHYLIPPNISKTTLSTITWCNILTANVWNRNRSMIVFGGLHYPFRHLLTYNFITNKWDVMFIKKVPKLLNICGSIEYHTCVIMDDMLYVFGGDCLFEETNLFCSFDLIRKKWKIINNNNPLNINIPGSRYDHVMWKDKNYGKKGAIYIGYGNHKRDKNDDFAVQRSDVWLFDIYESNWIKQEQNGNCAVPRSESGYVETKNNGVIIFGGYSSILKRYPPINNYNLVTYTFFKDCVEYLPKQNKWKLIQAEIVPPARGFPAACLLNNNILCLYGGYHGGRPNEYAVHDDIWILKLNRLKTSTSDLKICSYLKCNKTENNTQLFKCKGVNKENDSNSCILYYCSKYCQKRDWIRHRVICQKQLK